MKPDQAWQAALGQLQMEMPKATFDTWVRDTKVVSFEDGVFIIGTANEYAREWLEGRLSSTATRMLTGLMNQSIEVRFIVSKPYMSEEDGAHIDQKALQTAEEEKNLKIQLVHASLRDEFVHPNRVIVIPGYFQRWLPYLGPTLAWIVVAFRQAMFMATHREARTDVDFEISPVSVARWAGIGRTTLWRKLDDWMLGWFIERTARDKNTFRFVASMPLTPGDAESLYEWLLAAGIRSDPIDALTKSLAVEKGSIFPDPMPYPRKEHLNMKPTPESVQDVVLRACSRIDEKETFKKVVEMADQLAVRLMPPGDAIHVTHYFLLNHLPELGAAPAWFVTLMRDRCYMDKDTIRDNIWIRGGYGEIARMLGLQRPKTISEWLTPVFAQKAIPRPPQPDHLDRLSEYEYRAGLRADKRLVIQRFIQRIDYSNNASSTAWNFKISLVEPLSLADQVRYDELIDLVGTYLETGDRGEIDTILASDMEGGMVETYINQSYRACQFRRGVNETAPNADEARMKREEARLEQRGGANATRRDANETWERRGCNEERREWNALNSLNRLLKLLEKPDLNSTNPIDSNADPGTSPEPSGSPDSVVVVEPYWDISVLLARNSVISTNTQKKLLDQNTSPNAFVSWLIYTASPNGKGLIRPAQFAASKLMGNPQEGAGNVYDRLAALSPKALYELIGSALSCFEPKSTVPQEVRADWQSVMANASTERLAALKGQLFG
jgi:DnaA N-terminal domain